MKVESLLVILMLLGLGFMIYKLSQKVDAIAQLPPSEFRKSLTDARTVSYQELKEVM